MERFTGDSPNGRSAAIRYAWLTTAVNAALVAALLLFAAHGAITTLFGIAGLISLANALLITVYAPRRSRQVRAGTTVGRPLPTELHAIVLVVAVFAVATAVLTAAAVLTGH